MYNVFTIYNVQCTIYKAKNRSFRAIFLFFLAYMQKKSYLCADYLEKMRFGCKIWAGKS